MARPIDDMLPTRIEVVDSATGDACKTGKGAVFTNRARFDETLATLRALNTEGGRFLFDVYEPGDDGGIVETYQLTVTGFRRVIGEAPLTPEAYAKIDTNYWRRAITAYHRAHPNAFNNGADVPTLRS